MSSESVCQVAHSWVDVDSFHTRLFGVVYMTCGNFHDGSEKGTASVYQILCQSWEKCYGDSRSDSTSLRGPMLESRVDVSMACPVQNRSHISWWWWTSRRRRSCTTPETVARIQELLRQDRRRTSHNIAEEVGIGYGTCQRVLTEELRMHHVTAFTMTTPHLTLPSSPTSFWQKTKWLSSPTQHTPLIWHPVTSSFFQKWNWSWSDTGLIPLRRYRPNCRECLTLIKRTSRKLSKNGGDGGTGVYMREGTTSRVMAADRPYCEFYNFYSVSPENFGYHLVCVCVCVCVCVWIRMLVWLCVCMYICMVVQEIFFMYPYKSSDIQLR